MNQPVSTFSESAPHESIVNTLQKLESFIGAWAQTIEHTRHRVETISDMGMKSKDEIKQIREALAPHLADLQDVSKRLAEKFRANPTPFAVAAVGLVSGLLWWSYSQNRNMPAINAPVH